MQPDNRGQGHTRVSREISGAAAWAAELGVDALGEL